MSDWETILPIIVRNLINDTNSSSFTDLRVQTAIVVAGIIATQEFAFSTIYTFDLSDPNNPSISPDPVLVPDPLAVGLFSLKAACILSMNQYQSAVGRGIKVRDGDSQVDTTGSFKGFKDILELGPCGAYTTLLKQVKLNAGFGMGKAILGPSARGVRGAGIGTWEVRGFYDSLAFW